MASIPPPPTISASPRWTACAASMTDFSPEPHILFTVVAGTVSGTPAAMAACRAGAWPLPAGRAVALVTPSTRSGATAPPPQRRLDRHGAQPRRRDGGQPTKEPPDRRAHRAQDHDLAHLRTSASRRLQCTTPPGGHD